MSSWSFLTTRGRVLHTIAANPNIRVREIAELVGITQRSAYRILGDLVDVGIVARTRVGRRTRYIVNGNHPKPDNNVSNPTTDVSVTDETVTFRA